MNRNIQEGAKIKLQQRMNGLVDKTFLLPKKSPPQYVSGLVHETRNHPRCDREADKHTLMGMATKLPEGHG